LSGMKLSLDELKGKLVGFFRLKEEVLLAYLFGSSLQGKFGKDHDIDIGLFLSPKLYESLDEGNPYGYKAEMIAELMNLLKYDLIDLVILNESTPVLAYQVIHHGVLLFSRSEKTRVEFEVSSLKRHVDTKHLRNIKRVYSGKRIEKGLSAYD
jgi:predicted nucleotidyltransferase